MPASGAPAPSRAGVDCPMSQRPSSILKGPSSSRLLFSGPHSLRHGGANGPPRPVRPGELRLSAPPRRSDQGRAPTQRPSAGNGSCPPCTPHPLFPQQRFPAGSADGAGRGRPGTAPRPPPSRGAHQRVTSGPRRTPGRRRLGVYCRSFCLLSVCTSRVELYLLTV